MRSRLTPCLLASIAALSLLGGCAMMADSSKSGLSFFVTSAGLGKGADLGGLEGADRHCQQLAATARPEDKAVAGRLWRAYLSTTPAAGAPGVNARDRIGAGPWRNAKGVVIANDIDELHGANKLDKQTALTERGEVVNGRGDTPNEHDILTGSSPEGRAVTSDKDTTCRNWTSNSTGSALVGHHDRVGLNEEPPARSWNSSHPTRGCSAEALKATGGSGRFYCFAAD